MSGDTRLNERREALLNLVNEGGAHLWCCSVGNLSVDPNQSLIQISREFIHALPDRAGGVLTTIGSHAFGHPAMDIAYQPGRIRVSCLSCRKNHDRFSVARA